MKSYDVPFIANPNNRCKVVCVGMVLGYFMPEKHYTLAELDEFSGYVEGEGTWSALGMLNLAKLGFQLRWIEDFDNQQFVDGPEQYLRKILDPEALQYQLTHTDLAKEAAHVREYLESGLPYEQRPGTNEDIKRMLDDGWLVRLDVNANPLVGIPGFVGHAVLVIGYDENEVIIHNPDGQNGNKPNQHVSWELLDQVWKEFGGSYSLYAFKR